MTDPIAVAARFLAEHLEWMRHRPADQVREFLEDVDACHRAVLGIARGPADRRYLGPCGAPTWCDVSTFGEAPGTTLVEGAPCDGEVYARAYADTGHCQACGTGYDVAERRMWLDGLVGEFNYRAKWLADAYGISADTIRSWALRGQLAARGHDEDGHPLFNAGEVKELDRQARQRRAEREARGQRRTGDVA